MKGRVLVTGIGIISPIKPFEGLYEFWDTLCLGEDAIKKTKPPILDIGRDWLMACIAPSSFPDTIRPEDKLQRIAEKALAMAMEDAGLEGCPDIGLTVGTVLGDVLLKEKRLMGQKKQGEGRGNGKDSLSYITSHLADQYNLTGPNLTVSTACASGTDALGIAARMIEAGKADVMFAGGVDVLSDFAIMGFHALQALTEEKVRPFDKNRSGLALGEGAAFVVLESEKHAVQRKANVYGRFIGYASRADAHHLTGPHREGRGLANAINKALSQTNLKPNEINYINAHGTGTVYNDLMETKAIKKALGKSAYNVPISSTKSMLGHSFGASGVIEAICCLLSIKTNIIPPTINFQEQDPECDLDYVPNVSRKHRVKTAMSLSAGFGGQNSAIVFGEV
ncbi:MAG: beta-ketoacyl-[acyl-carrier-protein] synthase family protein [Candidatus Brocadiales bacterium]